MKLVRDFLKDGSDREVLISGAGDGTVKLWDLEDGTGKILERFSLGEAGDDSVLSIALDGSILYTGSLGGSVKIWNLDSQQLVRKINAHTVDIPTMAVGDGFTFSSGKNGVAKVWILPTLDDRKEH